MLDGIKVVSTGKIPSPIFSGVLGFLPRLPPLVIAFPTVAFRAVEEEEEEPVVSSVSGIPTSNLTSLYAVRQMDGVENRL